MARWRKRRIHGLNRVLQCLGTGKKIVLMAGVWWGRFVESPGATLNLPRISDLIHRYTDTPKVNWSIQWRALAPEAQDPRLSRTGPKSVKKKAWETLAPWYLCSSDPFSAPCPLGLEGEGWFYYKCRWKEKSGFFIKLSFWFEQETY